MVFIVFFFVIESKDRTLEEIDTMYVQKVNPITSGRSYDHDGGANSTKKRGHSEAAVESE